ncbi:ABC transporter permease [Jatrophihabitans sp. DSM 45814]
MKNPLEAHPAWRQLVIVAGLLPVMIALAILAFAWPAARIAPRELPLGIVGTPQASEQAVSGLSKVMPGGFALHRYANEASARAAIDDRDVYGALMVTSTEITVLEASAASATVAQLLTTVGEQLASEAPKHLVGRQPDAAPDVRIVDVVASSAGDPRGLVLSSALLPLTICSIIIASVIGLVIGFRPAWRQVVALVVVSGIAGLGAFLIAQSFLGALPGEHLATWAAVSLTLLAISSTAAGLIALIGLPGFALGAVLMVFVGNPFSGATSAPQLLPAWVDHVGQWLPPGSGANLLRSTAYFDGNGAAGHLAVLVLWTIFGLSAVVVGHHTSPRFAAGQSRIAASRPPQPKVAELAFQDG